MTTSKNSGVIENPKAVIEYIADALYTNGLDKLNCSHYGQFCNSLLGEYIELKTNQAGLNSFPRQEDSNIFGYGMTDLFYFFTPRDIKHTQEVSEKVLDYDKRFIKRMAREYAAIERKYEALWSGNMHLRHLNELESLCKVHPRLPIDLKSLKRNSDISRF